MRIQNHLMYSGELITLMSEIKRRYRNVLNKLISKKLYLTDFKQAFRSEREDIKAVIYFKWLNE